MSQGSVLSILLFIIVLEALYIEVKSRYSAEQSYADDLVLVKQLKS